MSTCSQMTLFLTATVAVALSCTQAAEKPLSADEEHAGRQFICLKDINAIPAEKATLSNLWIVVTPEIRTIPSDELIASWNCDPKQVPALKVEARALYPTRST